MWDVTGCSGEFSTRLPESRKDTILQCNYLLLVECRLKLRNYTKCTIDNKKYSIKIVYSVINKNICGIPLVIKIKYCHLKKQIRESNVQFLFIEENIRETEINICIPN